MTKRALKYTASFVTALLIIQMVFGTGLPLSRPDSGFMTGRKQAQDTVNDNGNKAPSLPDLPVLDSLARKDILSLVQKEILSDSITLNTPLRLPSDSGLYFLDSLMPSSKTGSIDTIGNRRVSLPENADRGIQQDSTKKDSLATKNFLDDIISGKNTDSVRYRPKEKLVYIYNQGDVTYGNMNMKADFMRMELGNKLIFATGKADSAGVMSRPIFAEGGSNYTMDTILYNISSGKAKIKGVATQQGDGFLIGREVKKKKDNSFDIVDGKYTTCDHIDHPHFYIAMPKAKVIPNKKAIFEAAYFVMEDVPTPLFIPEGFFPITQGRSSGILFPSYGEESTRGFFLRDGGYYWAINDYVDLAVTGSIYTYGSWEANVRSQYRKRYKFSGDLSATYANTVIGEKGDANYRKSPSLQVQWSHRQDPKASPGTTFAASVNFATSGFKEYVANDINDIVSTNTASSISYSRAWAGTPFSLNANLNLNVNSRDSTIKVTFPDIAFNVSKIFPFQRKNAVGKQRWYEKIAFSYSGNLTNSISAKEDELFTKDVFKNMNSGVSHSIPISTSFNLFNYINISPSANYKEVWLFREVKRTYDPNYTNPKNSTDHIKRDTSSVFKALRQYNLSISASTKVYGTYDFTSHKKFPLKMLRHTLTPSIGLSYNPDFGDPKYGYYLPYQPNGDGVVEYYTPYEGSYSVPGRGSSGSITFSLNQTLEAKVASKTDTTGMKKIKIIDNLRISSSYNLLADSMNLQPFSMGVQLAVPGLKNVNVQVSATLDPYDVAVNSTGTSATRINKFMIANGKGLGRITNASITAGYSFNSGKESEAGQPPAINNGAINPMFTDPFMFDPNNPMDPLLRRQMMSTTYYDFNIPWNVSFSYMFGYSNNNGVQKNLTQTINYNGSISLTKNWAIAINGGFDIMSGKPTIGMFTLVRDLHCWQMSFSWVPTGSRQSWQFKINIKSASLQDIKYDKQSSYLDNIQW